MTTSVTIAPSGPITTTETYITAPFAISAPAAGTCWRMKLAGTTAATFNERPTFNVRMGTAGTIADAIIGTISPPVAVGGASPFVFESLITVDVAGAVGTVAVACDMYGNLNAGVIGDDVTSALASGLLTGSISAPGAGYTHANTYTNVPLSYVTNGAGMGAMATIVVAGGIVTTVTITAPGENYTVGDLLTAANTYLGGDGSGFQYTATAVGVNTAAATFLGVSAVGTAATTLNIAQATVSTL